jgi:hypothetical protein
MIFLRCHPSINIGQQIAATVDASARVTFEDLNKAL